MFGHSYALLRQVLRSNEQITTELTVLSTRAAGTPLGRRAALYEAAARLCRGSGRDGQSWLFFGCAIDDYLLGGSYVQAESLCEEFITTYPDVVRARCTYTYLALRNEASREFIRRAELYEAAATAAYQHPLVIERFAMMRQVASHARSQIFLEERLRSLRGGAGDAPGAPFRTGGVDTGNTPEQRWIRGLRTVIVGPTVDTPRYAPILGGH